MDIMRDQGAGLPTEQRIRVATVTTESKREGKAELIRWAQAAHQASADLLVLPSSFLPFYGNPIAFYTQEKMKEVARQVHDALRGMDRIKEPPLIVVGYNEKTELREEGPTPLKFKSVAMMHQGHLVHHHRKSVLEKHYTDKGFTRGIDEPSWRNMLGGIVMMECFECLQPQLWPKGPQIVTVSVGFGMKAETENYKCDYWDQWMSVIRAQCLRTKSYCVLSCNGKHDDAMTAVVSPGGEILGTCKRPGMLVVDIGYTFTEKDRLRNPYAQE